VSILPQTPDKSGDATVGIKCSYGEILKLKSPRRKVDAAFEAGLFN
jgi:hypothetical protein